MTVEPHRAAILALHWQVNVTKPEGFFGPMLAAPVAHSGVIPRAAAFHATATLPVLFTRFTIPEGEGTLVRNTAFMRAVADAQEQFRPTSPGTQLIPEMGSAELVFDNQRLSGLAESELFGWLTTHGIDTVFITGVATNLTVEQTARHGTDLGLTVHVVSDCVAAVSEEVHAASLANLDLATAGCLPADEVLSLLK